MPNDRPKPGSSRFNPAWRLPDRRGPTSNTSAVTIIDTPEGRIVAEHEPSGGKKWMILAPGTTSNITAAVTRMMRRLPANDEWFSYRKVV